MSDITDELVRQAVDDLFLKFDKDSNSTLQLAEVRQFIEQALAVLHPDQAKIDRSTKSFIQRADKDADNRITKEQMFTLFKSQLMSKKK